jgi:actin-like protein 6A
MKLSNPFVRGELCNWEEVENMWMYSFSEQALGINPRETPVMAVAPTDLNQTGTAKYLELLFETFQVPSGYLLRKAVASSFAAGKTTALVIDSGAQGSIATTVCEGFALRKASARTTLGGNTIDQALLKYIERVTSTHVRPRFHFTKKRDATGATKAINVSLDVHDTVLKYHQLSIARDLKETHCSVPHTAYNETLANAVPATKYELPDGTNIEIGTCRYVIPEMLMNPKVCFFP